MEFVRKNPILVAAGVVAVIIVVAFFILATIFGWWPTTLDIVLIVAALLSLVLFAALVYAVLSLTRTALEIKAEMTPVLESLKTTSSAVREGAKTASTFGVSPAVRTASFLAGAGTIATTVLGRGQVQRRAERRQKRRQEIEREIAKSELNGHS
jgi:type IV secretory pathway VirB6-like protein